MNFFDNIKMALSSLNTHKMRSILTMLGIIIGVGSVIAIVAIGQGGEAMLKSMFVGSNSTVEIFYSPPEEEMEANSSAMLNSPFTEADIRALESVPNVKQVVASSGEIGSVSYRGKSVDSYISAINQAYIEVNDLKVEQGRNLLASDFLGGRRTAVVSSTFQEELFDGEYPLGKIIYIGFQPIEIVGILKEETSFFSMGSNDVYIPLNTWRNITGKNEISQITIQVENADAIEKTGKNATNLLNSIHNTEDSYQVMNMEEMVKGVSQVTRIMTIIIGSIAGVSLLVGGIGVMNIMLVSVTERTREIGVRMSLGATRGQILMQFLVESVTMTFIGGAIGIFLGAGVAAIITYFANWPSLVSLPVIIGGMLFSMIIGVIFGILPANKASRLDPVESMRYE